MKKVQDHYFHKAKKDGYVARSAFKLEEINQKHKFLHPGNRVMDLGCFPGSWMQYLSRYVGPKGLVLGVDRTELEMPLKPNMHFVHSDIYELDLNLIGEYASKYHVLCSDMAPNSTGIKDVDAARSLQLCQLALEIAQSWVKPGGHVIVKTFQGGAFDPLLKQMRTEYKSVKIAKPKSSRNESKEIFLLGMGKK